MASFATVMDQAVDLVKYKLVRSIDTGDAVMNNTLAVVAGGALTLGSGWIKTACGAASTYARARFFPGLDGTSKPGDAKDTGLVGDVERVQLRTGPTAVTAEMAVHALTVTDARQLRQLLDWVEVTYPTSCPRSESKRVPGERASWAHVSRRPLPSSSSASVSSSLKPEREEEEEEEEEEESVSSRSVWRRCVRKRRRTQSSAPPLLFADQLKPKTTAVTTTAAAAAATLTEIPYVTPRRRTARDLDAICSRYTMFAVWRHAGHAVFLSGARRSEKEREDDEGGGGGGGDDDDDDDDGGGGSRSWNLVVRSASADAALHFVTLFRDPTAEQLAAERALVVEAERTKAAAVAAAIAVSAAAARASAASKAGGRGTRKSAIPAPSVASDTAAPTDMGNPSSSSSSAETRMPARLQAYVLPEARDPDADPPTQRYAIDIMKLYALRAWPRPRDCQKLNARWSLDAMVFRDKTQIEALVADYERCLKAADPYGCRKIGIIVAGEYGTGKSSLLPALAQRLGMNVVRWDLSANADRDEVRAAFQFAVEQRCIISLDEIDKLLDRLASPQLAALAAERARELADAKELMLALEKVDETKHAQARDAYVRLVAARNKEPIDLAFLQSLLDGVDDSSGRVIVASTNHPERIPPALLRPGRFDVQSRMRHFSGAQTRQLMRLMFLWRTAKTCSDDDDDDDDERNSDDAESGREEKCGATVVGDEESKTPRSDRSSSTSCPSSSSSSSSSSLSALKLAVGDSKNSSSSSTGGGGNSDSKSERREQEGKEEKRSCRTTALVPRTKQAVALAAELRRWCGYSERDANAAAWLDERDFPEGVWSPAQVVSARQKHRTLRATAMYLSTQRPENFSERVVPPHVSSSSLSSASSASASATLSAASAASVTLTLPAPTDSSAATLLKLSPTETLPTSTEKPETIRCTSNVGSGVKRRRADSGDKEEEEEEEEK